MYVYFGYTWVQNVQNFVILHIRNLHLEYSMIAASVKVQEQQQMNRSKKFGKNKVNPNER